MIMATNSEEQRAKQQIVTMCIAQNDQIHSVKGFTHNIKF